MIGRPLSHTQQSLGLGAVIQKGAIASGRCVKMGLGMVPSLDRVLRLGPQGCFSILAACFIIAKGPARRRG